MNADRPGCSVLRVSFIALVAGILALAAKTGSAITPGRAWTPFQRLNEPGFADLVSPRLDTGPDGVPRIVAEAVFGPNGDDGIGYRWTDTGWVRIWALGQAPLFAWPVISPPGTSYLACPGGSPSNNSYFLLFQYTDAGVSSTDTIAAILPYDVEYSAAVSRIWRWAVVYDTPRGTCPLNALRAFASSTPHHWAESRLCGNSGVDGVAATALDDSTGLVAWADGFVLGLGLVRGAAWSAAGQHTGVRDLVNRPRFRPRPSGGQWLAWGTSTEYILVATYRDGVLGVPDTLRCAYRSGGQHFTDSPDLSRDGGEYPAAAWGSQINGNDVLCVMVPTDAGFTVADEIPGAAGGTPTVARDMNGDVWVASWDYNDTANWLHTYTIATCSAPRLSGAGVRRTVEWTLSEPAPETWWAVLKSVRGGDYVPVARVRAGPSVEMSWSDAEPPAAIVSYKIRRECVDARYVWESDAVSFPRGARPPIYLGPPRGAPGDPDGEPVRPEERPRGRVGLSLAAAAPGPIVVRVYDLQGRMVLEQRVMAQGTDRVAIALDFGQARQPLASGVYFARASDEAGNASATVRVVFLK